MTFGIPSAEAKTVETFFRDGVEWRSTDYNWFERAIGLGTGKLERVKTNIVKGPERGDYYNRLIKPAATSTKEKFINGIATAEGFFAEQKDGANRPQRNYNPGNLVHAGQPNSKKEEHGKFAVFDSPEAGARALFKQVEAGINGTSKVYKPTDTLHEFILKYAPKKDGNNIHNYSVVIAQALGVDIKDLKKIRLKDLT